MAYGLIGHGQTRKCSIIPHNQSRNGVALITAKNNLFKCPCLHYSIACFHANDCGAFSLLRPYVAKKRNKTVALLPKQLWLLKGNSHLSAASKLLWMTAFCCSTLSCFGGCKKSLLKMAYTKHEPHN